MSKLPSFAFAAALAMVSSLGCEPENLEGQAATPLSAPGGDSCAAVSPTEITALLPTLEAALALARADEAANGVTGAYAVAARYNREYLEQAIAKVHSLLDWLASLPDPDQTTYAEAYSVAATMNDLLASLPTGGHWAIISSVYHHSDEARRSFELGAQALEVANELRAQGYRCYSAPYLE